MTIEYLFTTLIMGIGSLHLLWRGGETIGRWLAKKNGMTATRRQGRTRRRDDWYLFFHRSDLLGERSAPSGDRQTGTRTPATTAARRPRKRRAAPRLRLS